PMAVPPSLPALAPPPPVPELADLAVAVAPTADLAPASAAAPAPAAPAPPSLQERVNALIDADKLAEAERLLLAQGILEPKAGWVHLQLGELYARRIWRKDAEREWTTALALDPSLRADPRLTGRLCGLL